MPKKKYQAKTGDGAVFTRTTADRTYVAMIATKNAINPFWRRGAYAAEAVAKWDASDAQWSSFGWVGRPELIASQAAKARKLYRDVEVCEAVQV